MSQVPFADLHAQYQTIKREIDDAIARVISSSAFIRGPFVEKFEAEFAETLGVEHCVSCANGTDAIYIAMHALGVKPGDEVITTAHSWIATSETISQTGANVVFCDTEKDSFNIDASQIEAKITSRTVGIIPVHLYGQPADMDAIMAIAKKHGLWVIEDCAQAHLARYKGRYVGTFGEAATFSFYPGKNLGAMGDAGAVVSNDEALAKRMAMFARHGGLTKGDHQIEGINSRLDGIQAAILSVKLRRLSEWTRSRRDKAAQYNQMLGSIPGISLPLELENREHVYHLYVVRHEGRDQMAKTLAMNGIQTVINYPVALPFLPAYARLAHKPEDFPNAWSNQSRILSLPIYPEMHESAQRMVAEKIQEFCLENLDK
jgi:dTDP-4-amino-4,6-dideoxygalactose transaminase